MNDLPQTPLPTVFVVLLNWNGWRDTVECLESIFRLNYPNFCVVVCDNASADGSLECIASWAKGDLSATCDDPGLSYLVFPPVPKPIPVQTFRAGDLTGVTDKTTRLVMISTGSNLGFAGGCNVGIRYALAQRNADYVWLLNNDTVVDGEALITMVRMAEADARLGICGSLLRSYHAPYDIQTAGGRRYLRWTGRTRPMTKLDAPRVSTESGSPDYIEGASMLVGRKLLEEVGLLEESYFLYFEEIDWVMRARPRFHFGYTTDSVVYHKEGASAGSALKREHRSALSDYYLSRSRILFTARYCPWFLPSVLIALSVSMLQRILIGRGANSLAMLRGAFDSFRDPGSRRRLS
jgi:GT2 family glycosyltransferase